MTIVSNEGEAETKEYPINYGAKLKVEDGDVVEAGDELIEGSINPHDLLRILGVKAVQDYLVKEVQSVYRRQGVEIADKHIEVIVRQMLRKVKVEEANDTNLLPGALVDIFRFDRENRKTLEEGGRPATAKRTLLGITKPRWPRIRSCRRRRSRRPRACSPRPPSRARWIRCWA